MFATIPMKTYRVACLVVLLLPAALFPVAAPAAAPSSLRPEDKLLAEYFRAETAKLSARCFADINSLNDWTTRRDQYRQELFDMLGLTPQLERTELKPVITGKLEQEQFTVENLHFQSRPGLYVTANLYLPKGLTKPAPTILYVCGHGPVISNNVSYGNKVSYQHHGAWFARHGYVCLIIDTVQLGEILGLHHGTYREGQWWWNARGYTPAGVEAWNSIRALDYLATRPEVDTNRFGVTGRSGGGAYSWWLVALDHRVKAAAPVAGITDLQNYVVDGAVEGHCDCMFFVNTYRWDYPLVAALAAPRPLLLVNSDSDTIFPLDGVMRTHAKVRQIYALYQATNQFGLVIGPGPHKDTQDLQVPVFRWFNRHLKGEDPVIERAAVKFFTPQQLKVFTELPADAINTNIHAQFVPVAAPPVVPPNATAWQKQRAAWLAALRERTFGGWPDEPGPLEPNEVKSIQREGLRFQAFDFTSQPHVPLHLHAVRRMGTARPDHLVLNVGGLEQQDVTTAASVPPSDEQLFAALQQRLPGSNVVLVHLAPRGLGLSAWSGDLRKQTHLRRRFMLLGQTLDGMRVWDIRRAVQAIRALPDWQGLPVTLQAEGDLAMDALYAALFEPDLAGLDLTRLPSSHRNGPDFLNVLRILDLPQAVAMAAERAPIRLRETDPQAWRFADAVVTALGWDRKRLDCAAAP